MLKSLIVLPDIHFPYHHRRAINSVLEFCADHKPDRAVQLGDAYDFYRISSFPKTAGAGMSIFKEVNAGKFFWASLLGSCGRVDYLPGNHEERFQKQILDANPALADHPAFNLKKLLLLPDEVHVHPYHHKLVVNNILITHGDELRGTKAKFKAANVLANYPNQHTVFGHLHIIDLAEKVVVNYDKKRTYMSRCIGWLGDQNQEAFKYAPDAPWQLGFLWVEFYGSNNQLFTAHQIEMQDGRFSFGGKVYGAR